MARQASSMEDDYENYAKTLQEELNEITEAVYELLSDEDILSYQAYVENIRKQRIAEGAKKYPSMAPDFQLIDQDGETVQLKELLKMGPVVLVFYRGKWCPHCNAYLMRLQQSLKEIHAKGATFIAISPMLPDGTQYLATKRSLEFPVLSDVGNTVARKYNLTFIVPEEIRPRLQAWGYTIPAHNGDESWEIPLPAIYIIDPNGKIAWSYIDNDPTCRAEPADVVAAIPLHAEKQCDMQRNHNASTQKVKSVVKKRFRSLFGRKKQKPEEFLSNYIDFM